MLDKTQQSAAVRIALAINNGDAEQYKIESASAKMNEMTNAQLLEFKELVHEIADKGEG